MGKGSKEVQGRSILIVIKFKHPADEMSELRFEYSQRGVEMELERPMWGCPDESYFSLTFDQMKELMVFLQKGIEKKALQRLTD